MQIDWLTVSAQIVNFLILVYLLKRFLYVPIVRTMDRREQSIADRLREAEERKRAAEQEAQDYRERRDMLEAQRQGLVKKASEEVKAQRIQMLDALRAEIADMRTQWRAEVEREKKAFLRDVRQEVGRKVATIARKTLQDLGGATLEQQMVRRFLERLRSLSEKEKVDLTAACRTSALVFVTAFDLGEKEEQAVLEQLRETFADVQVQFRRSTGLVCGVAIEVPGRKWVWGVDSYLEGLEDDLMMALDQASGAGGSHA